MESKKPIRIAPIIRVSTESQEKKGESLRTQHSQIRQWVNSNAHQGWTIPEELWKRYSGQEHATPDQERGKLDKLIKDAKAGLFDAVIVCDASRWSRDNLDSKQRLKILRDNNIRFFVATQEYNLFDPQQLLFLGMATEMNEFFALEQARKSMLNRIERAKRGIPTNGKLPFGRKYNREEGVWSIIPEDKKNIQKAAKQYLSGTPIPLIASQLRMNPSNLWKILKKRSGEKWEIRFKSERLGIDEPIVLDIPPLLDPETIEAIHKQAEANKTYNHGEIKYKYLLSRMIRCSICGYSMFGQTNRGEHRYYRHARDRKKECNVSSWVPAEPIERAVVRHLFSTFGDKRAMERAIEEAHQGDQDIGQLTIEKEEREKELTSIRRKIDQIVLAISNEEVSRKAATRTLGKLEKQEQLTEHELEEIIGKQNRYYNYKKGIEQSVSTMRGKFIQLARRQATIERQHKSSSQYFKMSYEDERGLLQDVLGGKDQDGNSYGVYVQKGKASVWEYKIKGKTISRSGKLPMSKEEASHLASIPTMAEIVGPEDFRPPMNPKEYKKFIKEHGHKPAVDIETLEENRKPKKGSSTKSANN